MLCWGSVIWTSRPWGKNWTRRVGSWLTLRLHRKPKRRLNVCSVSRKMERSRICSRESLRWLKIWGISIDKSKEKMLKLLIKKDLSSSYRFNLVKLLLVEEGHLANQIQMTVYSLKSFKRYVCVICFLIYLIGAKWKDKVERFFGAKDGLISLAICWGNDAAAEYDAFATNST